MKGRVLIADYELSLSRCVATFLETKDFEVQTVGSAASAIVALGSSEFDVVITDIALETQTAGYDIVRAAKCQFYEPEVVVFTSLEVDATECKRRGVKKLFPKGDVEISTVSNAVNKIFDERARRRALSPTGVN
jgi:DNA-binding NtrC family response regulator